MAKPVRRLLGIKSGQVGAQAPLGHATPLPDPGAELTVGVGREEEVGRTAERVPSQRTKNVLPSAFRHEVPFSAPVRERRGHDDGGTPAFVTDPADQLLDLAVVGDGLKRFRQRHPAVIAVAFTDEIAYQPRRLRVPFTVARWGDLHPDHIPIV